MQNKIGRLTYGTQTVMLQCKHTDLPFRGDLSCCVSNVKLIHEQILVLTERHKTRKKVLSNLHFFRKSNFPVVSSYMFSNTLIFSLASLWISFSLSTTYLRLCTYFIKKISCISLKLFYFLLLQNETGGSFSACQS